MDPLALQLLLDRFDTLEELVRDNGKKLDDHKEDDLAVASTVTTHSTYWNIFTWVVCGLVATAFTWVGTHLR